MEYNFTGNVLIVPASLRGLNYSFIFYWTEYDRTDNFLLTISPFYTLREINFSFLSNLMEYDRAISVVSFWLIIY